MATSKDVLKTDSLWRDRPCHFTWDLSARVFINYDNIVYKLDYDLEETKNLLFVEKLLFRAFLEVSDHRHYRNVSKAREFLDRADDHIATNTPPQLQNGYRSVALLNRLHIEYKSQNDKQVEDLLCKLQELELNEKDRHVIGAVKATALTRLGPDVRDDAGPLFKAAHKYFPTNPGFLFGALLMVGRKVRFERHVGDHYDDLESDGKELMDIEKTYCERLVDINDEYQLGRSFLGQNLSRRGSTHKEDARAYLEEAFKKAPKVKAVFHNLVRFYRDDDVKKAIDLVHTVIASEPCLNVAETHHQLALCFNSKANRFRIPKKEKDKWTSKSLRELDKCLQIDSKHLIAATRKAIVLSKHGDKIGAQKLYEDLLLQCEKLSIELVFSLHVDYARFLTKTSSPKRLGIWSKVMESSSSFENIDVKTGRWKVKRRIKTEKEEAYKILSEHYKENSDDISQGILYFQHFEFEKAVELFERLNTQSNQRVPFYLANVYFNWGREKEASALAQTAPKLRSKEDLSSSPKSCAKRVLACTFLDIGNGGQCKRSTGRLVNVESVGLLEKADECYTMARDNSKLSTKLGLKQATGRKLLADIALATAHLQLCKSPIGQAQESKCIHAYREAVRCGSLVACLEILRLHHEGYVEIISRSKFIQILAEIYVCCSQPFNDCVHREIHPRSFKDGSNSSSVDDDFSALNCKTIQRDFDNTLRKDGFFRQAWKAHFDMEKQVIEERYKNSEGGLELDGREEGQTEVVGIDTTYAAIDCCEKLRPLLDHINFSLHKDKLKVKDAKKHQYFPIVLGEQDPVLVEQQLQDKLKSLFEIDFKCHYPKLYKQLLGVQPGYNTKCNFLEQFWSLVIHIKHKGIELSGFPGIERYAVPMTRQCTDTVEDICNFFFDAMKDSSELRKTMKKLVTDFERSPRQDMHEMCKKADQLWHILSDRPDLVIRTGSTWEIIEMLALIKQIWEHSGPTGDLEVELTKMTEGSWDPSKNLRRLHFELELALLRTADRNSEDVLKKCRDACEEADQLLDAVLLKKTQDESAGNVVKFPFEDERPSHQRLDKADGYDHWRGKVKNRIVKGLKQMQITSSVKPLVDTILKVQPCYNDDNYNFIALRVFIDMCKTGNIPNSVHIKPLDKHVPVVDLTRWCVDHVEKTAAEVEKL
ncbi:uncharacterized protein [Asterias amurensis]|uniref:uncharacterized protein n=1 Tax=Asterias amurensis TaxID=7602 RepID=UPI003AB76ECF